MRTASPGISVAGLKVAIYTRVSTEDQADGHSLDYQRDACRAYAEKLGADSIEVYEDAGFSGKTAKRPAFQRLMADAQAGRFNAVVIYKGDRFARSILDSLLAKQKLKDAGVTLHNVTEPFDDTPAGFMGQGMLQLVAEWYSLDLQHKVTAGLRKRAEKGLPNAMPPFGYRQSLTPTAEPPSMIAEEATAVQEAFDLFAMGTHSYREIAARFNQRGFRTRHRAPKDAPEDGPRLWSGDSIRSLIQNAFYRGVVTHKGEELPGRHEPIVTEELWRRANEVGRRLRGKATWRQKNFYSLAGIIKCAHCGSSLQGNSSQCGQRYRYYRETAARRGVACSSPQIAVRADRVEAEVDAIVARLRMPKNVRQRVIQLLSEDSDPREVETKRIATAEKLRRIERLYADLALTDAEYTSQRRKLEMELARLTVPAKKATEVAGQFDVLQMAWKRATSEEKRALGLALFEAVYYDLETMTIGEVVLQPAFRPWLAQA